MDEITLCGYQVPSGMPKKLWNDESVHILLTEYKKLKDSLGVRRSSNMTKKGWELIKRKLHAAGYLETRFQHVVKKFSSLKLYYKEFREGIPVKHRIHGFINLLSEILDDDPYIAFAKPTKRMKEKIQFENKYLKSLSQAENFMGVEYSNNEEEMKTNETSKEIENVEEVQYIDASMLLTEHIGDNPNNEEITDRGYLRGRTAKNKRKLSCEIFDKPNMPSWISYLMDLLKKEEQQKSEQLWKLHEQIVQAERVKTDMLERLITLFGSNTNNILTSSKPVVNTTKPTSPSKGNVIVTKSKMATPRNIIIVDEEGSIFLKPTDAMKLKGEPVEYSFSQKIFKQPEFQDANGVEVPQIQLQFINEDEIIIENCQESEIYQMEPVYEDVEEMNVISHVEIIEESEVEGKQQLDTIDSYIELVE